MSEFNLGDRVKHWRNGQMGTVEGLGMTHTTFSGRTFGNLVGVKFDNHRGICRQGPKTLLLIRRATRPTAPTGSSMELLKNRKWETSYTKKVVDFVCFHHDTATVPGNSTYQAVELLKQYHRDLHLPYEQRDEALARVKELAAANKYLLGEITELRASLPYKVKQGMGRSVWCAPYGEKAPFLGDAIKSDIYKWAAERVFDALAKPEPKKQVFMACGHYPNALSNFFEKRDHCEFCCEKEPLKWCDNGRHREPGK